MNNEKHIQLHIPSYGFFIAFQIIYTILSNFELSQKSEIRYSLSFTNLDVVCSNHASFCCYLLAFYIFSRSLALCLPLYFFSLFLLTLYLIDKINETLIYSTPIRWHNNTKSQHFFCSKTRRITAFMWKDFMDSVAHLPP